MMKNFKRVHWVYTYFVVCLLFLIVLVIDLKQAISLIKQNHTTAKELQVLIEKAKTILLDKAPSQRSSLLKIDNTLLEGSSVLPRLAHFFELQGMRINKIRLYKIKVVNGVNILPIKMRVIGDSLAIIQLLKALAASAQPILLNDFSLQVDKQGAATAQMQLWAFALSRESSKLVNGRSKKSVTDASLQAISLKKIKRVGYLHYQNTLYGFLMLPSGKTVQVSKGSRVGKERARIIEITEKGVVYA